ncbi:phosphodiester glycosidase family protein [Actibacterium ureilyticum]|uniref:phosphodiester glycosidase family protein n=1 Tax=Actibacterium ureilyticum TaxID=1590614 RepID=UPI000BAAE52D|nr:phosphodiester glycosidase family protein [Actibacterium ureilyticum]
MTTTIKATLMALLLAALSTATRAADCRPEVLDDLRFTVCTVDPKVEALRLFRTDADGVVLGSFARVDAMLEGDGTQLGFAMNAGMYHADRAPVGLYIENGEQTRAAVPNAGPGNFGLLPNGIFCVFPGGARVIETLTYIEESPTCTHATQSGPMLVIDGELHPRFLVDSTSRYIRNGVGVDADGLVHFAISDSRVRFHEFGRLFRDVLKTPNALYFDGKISRLYAPGIDRHDAGFPMGPIIGTVVPRSR